MRWNLLIACSTIRFALHRVENLCIVLATSLQVYAIFFGGHITIDSHSGKFMGFYLPRNFDSPTSNHPVSFGRWHISLSKWLQDYLYIPLGGNRTASVGTYACILTIALIGIILSGSIWVAIILIAFALIVTFCCHHSPEKKKSLTSNMNRMNTMLLGGLWHGASWNFMIWGGLNGIGLVVYRFWKDLGHPMRLLVISLVTATCFQCACIFSAPFGT